MAEQPTMIDLSRESHKSDGSSAHHGSARPTQHFHSWELTRFPMTLRSLVRKTTMMTRGGANKPLRMADQNSILTALNPAKSNASPTAMETRDYGIELCCEPRLQVERGVSPFCCFRNRIGARAGQDRNCKHSSSDESKRE